MKRVGEVRVTRRTVNGRKFYPYASTQNMTAQFSKTGNTIYLPNGITLERAKGRGHFVCTETGDEYGVLLRGSRKKA